MEHTRGLWLYPGLISAILIVIAIVILKRDFIRQQIKLYGINAVCNMQKIKFRRSVPVLNSLIIDTAIRNAVNNLIKDECNSAGIISSGFKLLLEPGRKNGMYIFYIDQVPFYLRVCDLGQGMTSLEISKKRDSDFYGVLIRPILGMILLLIAAFQFGRIEYLTGGLSIMFLLVVIFEIDVTGRTHYIAHHTAEYLRDRG